MIAARCLLDLPQCPVLPQSNKKLVAGKTCDQEGTNMMDGKGALIQAHRNNIARYQRLLDTRLTDNERQYLESRLSEEQSALQRIAYSSLRPGEIEMQLKIDLDQPVRL